MTGEQPGWDKPVPPTAPRAVGRTLAANEKVPGQEYPYWVFIPTGREIDYAMSSSSTRPLPVSSRARTCIA